MKRVYCYLKNIIYKHGMNRRTFFLEHCDSILGFTIFRHAPMVLTPSVCTYGINLDTSFFINNSSSLVSGVPLVNQEVEHTSHSCSIGRSVMGSRLKLYI